MQPEIMGMTMFVQKLPATSYTPRGATGSVTVTRSLAGRVAAVALDSIGKSLNTAAKAEDSAALAALFHDAVGAVGEIDDAVEAMRDELGRQKEIRAALDGVITQTPAPAALAAAQAFGLVELIRQTADDAALIEQLADTKDATDRAISNLAQGLQTADARRSKMVALTEKCAVAALACGTDIGALVRGGIKSWLPAEYARMLRGELGRVTDDIFAPTADIQATVAQRKTHLRWVSSRKEADYQRRAAKRARQTADLHNSLKRLD